MLKFHQIVLRKFLALFTVLFLIVGAIVYFWEYQFYLDASRDALLQDVELIALQIDKDTDLDTLAQEVKNKLDIRLTIIDANGTVIAESHKNKLEMENHRYRDEIMLSDTQPYGYKQRHSSTLDKELLYVAKKHTIDGQTIYIRLAKELKGINDAIIQLALKILSVLTLFFIAIFIVTYKINSQVEYEVGKIITFLKSLTKKQKSTYIKSDYSQEFALITNLLTKVSQIIVKKERLKSKYTDKLKASNKQKDDIISAISHEFKNPIAVVNGYSQTLIEDEDINPNIRKKFLKKILNNGVKLSSLIDTLRLSMKLDGKNQQIKKQKTNLYQLIIDVYESLEASYPYKELHVTGDKNLEIAVDPSLFSVALSNLIENAFKYSEDEVHVNFDSHKIEVIDTGIGIAPANLEKITEKFYRINTNAWNNSLGLGLFLVNRIVKLHNFSLEIRSKINEGSTFTIRF